MATMENTYLPPRVDEDGFPQKEPNPNVFEIYSREAKSYDAAMVERWRTAMEGILIFAGLFSAAVTAFIIESYRTLQPDQSDRTVDLLYQISQQLAGTPVLPLQPDIPFSPPWTAVATNILWFMSLGLSLACAVAATLVQQWARNYIHTIERRPSAARRARMRMYLFEGVEKFGMSQLIDGIPALLHLSLFTFFLGLVFFIQGINTPVTVVAIGMLAISAGGYLIATMLPLFSYNSPIQTPLTALFWHRPFIQPMYWVCAHAILVFVELRLFCGVLVRPFVSVWTAIDLIARQLFAMLHTQSSFRTVALSTLATPLQTRRAKLLEQWSSSPLSNKTLDTMRASIARDHFSPAFWQREQNAFIWLVQCLDGERELLPFLEALPSYVKGANQYRLQFDKLPDNLRAKVVSAMLLHSSLEFHTRVVRLRRNYPTSARVLSAYLDFQLLVEDDMLLSLFAANPDYLNYYFRPAGWSSLRPDLHIKSCCSEAVAIVTWSRKTQQKTPALYSSLHHLHQELKHRCSTPFDLDDSTQNGFWSGACLRRGLFVPGTSSIRVWQPRLPYFTIAHFYLQVIPKVTAENTKLISSTLIRVHRHIHSLNVYQSPFTTFPQQELLYCSLMELLVRLFNDSSEQSWQNLDRAVFICFADLAYISTQSSMDVVLRILESDIWLKHDAALGEIFRDIFNAHRRRSESCFPQSIMQKYQILALNASWYDIPRTLDLVAPTAAIQQFFTRTMRHLLLLYPEEHDFTTWIRQFDRLDDPSALQEALIVTQTFLQMSRDDSGDVARCQDSLRELIASKRRREVAVQVMIRPEAAVQVG